jgi:hypothetical protein
MGSDSPWAKHRNAKTTRGEKVSNWVSDQIDAGGPNKRHADRSKESRDVVPQEAQLGRQARGRPRAKGRETRQEGQEVSDNEYTCSRCGAGVRSLAAGLDHAIRNHNMTRQQAQNERTIHKNVGKRK